MSDDGLDVFHDTFCAAVIGVGDGQCNCLVARTRQAEKKIARQAEVLIVARRCLGASLCSDELHGRLSDLSKAFVTFDEA